MAKTRPKKEAELTELFNGRSQMVVSSFYHNAGDPRAQKCAKRFFDDYKKLVPVKDFVENLAIALEVCTECELEDGRLDFEQMEQAEGEVAEWLKGHLGLSRRRAEASHWTRTY